jgi:hypothetical protein
MIKTEPVICPLTCGFRWQQAPRAGLESPAYCLGGKPEPGRTTPTVALRDTDLGRQSPDAARLLLTLAPSLAPHTPYHGAHLDARPGLNSPVSRRQTV